MINKITKLIISGVIDDELFTTLATEFLKNPGKITILLNSAGGDAYSALAISALIRQRKSDITVIGYGLIASAAVLILAAAGYRVMTKESWVMVHEDSGKIKGDVRIMEVETKHLRNMEYQWIDLLEDYTTTPSDEWEKLHKQTTYLTAKQCLELGLIDEVK